MKRFAVFALIIACILGLTACATTTSGQISVSDYHKFSELLDQENFVPGLGQIDFRKQIEQYSYNGHALDTSYGHFFDGPQGGGYSMSNDIFGLSNNYQTTDDGIYAVYTNSFFAHVPLTGLTVPYGIQFNDSLSSVLEALHIRIDPFADFASDKGNEGIMTLCGDRSASLELHDYSKMPNTSSDGYRLVYTETYESTRADGRPVTVTRAVFMIFTGEDILLTRFGMFVKEKYQID